MADFTLQPAHLHMLWWTPEEWRAAMPETMDRDHVIRLMTDLCALIRERPQACSLAMRMKPGHDSSFLPGGR